MRKPFFFRPICPHLFFLFCNIGIPAYGNRSSVFFSFGTAAKGGEAVYWGNPSRTQELRKNRQGSILKKGRKKYKEEKERKEEQGVFAEARGESLTIKKIMVWGPLAKIPRA
jgi:hypothetical protein